MLQGLCKKYPSTYWHTINCTDMENILIFYEAANEAKPDKNKTHCTVYFIHMFSLCSVCECVHECRHPHRQKEGVSETHIERVVSCLVWTL